MVRSGFIDSTSSGTVAGVWSRRAPFVVDRKLFARLPATTYAAAPITHDMAVECKHVTMHYSRRLGCPSRSDEGYLPPAAGGGAAR
jgi:hypothetical protein